MVFVIPCASLRRGSIKLSTINQIFGEGAYFWIFRNVGPKNDQIAIFRNFVEIAQIFLHKALNGQIGFFGGMGSQVPAEFF